MLDLDFYKKKKVFVTGHTGFKGSWLCKILIDAGADVTGYALEPPTEPSLFNMTELNLRMHSIVGDIRDYNKLKEAFEAARPEIVFHLAAQPIVRDSYKDPVRTYETNVMGTVYLLECIRNVGTVKSVINVTTDKVYKNREWNWGYRENEELNGYDPYSNSKSCSELVTSCYINSFWNSEDNDSLAPAVSTMRAGNVIGGGDFANDRIIPDCIRAAMNKSDIIVRNPYSTRPYQHVLEPVMAYLMLAQMQYGNKELAGNYNIGPDERDCVTTGEIVDIFCKSWKSVTHEDIKWINKNDKGPHEANFLKLDCSKIKAELGWKPVWDIETAVGKSVEWTECCLYGAGAKQVEECMAHQIGQYVEEIRFENK